MPPNNDNARQVTSPTIVAMSGPTNISVRQQSVPQDQRFAVRALRAVLNRTGLAGALGMSFEGKRDLWGSFGWDLQINLDMIMDMYLRGGIARRIVEAKPDATWGRPPSIYHPDQPDWTTEFYKLAWDLDLWSTFRRADILAGLGRYSIILIGTNRGALERALPTGGAGALKITYLQPYGESQVRIKEWEQDPTNARFGLPTMYTIMNNTSVRQLNSTGTPDMDARPQGSAFDVHWSRVIHVARGGLTNCVFGVPEYAPIWNYLCDLMKVVGASSESYWRVAYPGLHADVDKDMDMDAEDEENLSAEFDEFQHEMRRIIRTRGVTVKDIGSKVADPRGAFDVILTLISGTTGIPKRILLGSEAGQLASSQDKGSWAERIEEYREDHAEPRMVWPFVMWVINNGIIPMPGDIQLLRALWPDAYRQSPLERSQTAAQTARSLANIAKGMQPIEMTPAVDAVPGTPASTNPITGEVTPATPGVEGVPAVLAEPIINRDEARRILGFSTDQNLLASTPEELGN
jgi:hypothetical protein